MEFDPIGVTPTPEVTHFELTGQEQVLIVASDGLWEFVSSSQAVTIAMKSEDATAACDALLQLSKKKWSMDGLGNYCDDITILVVFLPLLSSQLGSHQTASAMSASGIPESDGGEVALELVEGDKKVASTNKAHEIEA